MQQLQVQRLKKSIRFTIAPRRKQNDQKMIKKQIKNMIKIRYIFDSKLVFISKSTYTRLI